MDGAHVDALRAAGTITARAHAELRALVDAGVTDPCVAGAPPGVARLWYEHAPKPTGRLSKAIADVRDLVVSKGRAQVHYGLAAALARRAACVPLDALLAGWLRVTRDPTILEAIAWQWLAAQGEFADELREAPGPALPVEAVSAAPHRLLRLLTTFQRQFRLWRTFAPCAVVDALALAQGWWSEGSEVRTDAFVLDAVRGALGEEHEWAPMRAVTAAVHGVEEEEVAASVARLCDAQEVVRLEGCDGLAMGTVVATARAVKHHLLPGYASAVAEGYPLTPPPVEDGLNREQAVVFERVACRGARLTLCISPAGTGKTHVAARVARYAARVLCLAPSWKAVAVLRGKLSGGDVDCEVEFRTVQGFCCTDDVPDVDLVVVDELSMLTMHHVCSILRAYADHARARLLFLGDDMQLPCIGAGSPIRDLAAQLSPVRLVRCMRTEGRELVAAATAVRDGRSVEEGGAVCVHAGLDMPAIVARLTHTAPATPPWADGYVQIVTPQNNHVRELNALVQEKLGLDAQASLGDCRVGDAVRITANADEYKNGDEGVLVGIEEAEEEGKGTKKKRAKKRSRGGGNGGEVGVVEWRSGARARVAAAHLAPAYATTIHKVQGSEYAAVVFALPDGINPRMLTRELAYTAVTRARHALHIAGRCVGVVDRCARAERRSVFAFV